MIPDPNLQMSVKRSFFNSVNEKLRFGSGIMQRVTVSVFCKKNAKITVLETFNLWLVKTKNYRKNCIFGFSQKITPDVSTTFTRFTTFFCSPPLDFLSHALTENFRDALSTNRTLVSENKNDRKNRIFHFFAKEMPLHTSNFMRSTTFVCSPPLDFGRKKSRTGHARKNAFLTVKIAFLIFPKK